MSYMQTIKLGEHLHNSVVTAEGYDTMGLILNPLKEIVPWSFNSSDNSFQIASDLKLTIYYSRQYICKISTTDSLGNEVSSGAVLMTWLQTTNTNTLYLNYCKSPDNKTIAFGISCTLDGGASNYNVTVIVDIDDDNRASAIIINPVSNETHWENLITGGNICNINNLNYEKTGTKPLVTSLCKLPNYLMGGTLKNVYKILSCPLDNTEFYKTVFDIDGRKYQGVTGGNNTTYPSYAILAE